MQRRSFCTRIAVAFASLGLPAALAQTDATIKLVVPFPPGGATDLIARLLADKLTGSLGQPVIVENKAGAAGSIGAEYVAKAAPDGRTLLLGTLSTHGTNPAMPGKTSYDPVNDFSPITLLAVSPLVFFAHPDVPASRLDEFVRYAKARPGVPFASNGVGSYNQLATQLLQTKAGIRLLHVPYKGAAEVMNAVAAGQVQFAAGDLAGVTPFVQSGRVKALAIASAGRFVGFEAIPTVAECGFPDFQVEVWYALFGPAGMAQAQLQRLRPAVVQAMDDPDMKRQLAALGPLPKSKRPCSCANA